MRKSVLLLVAVALAHAADFKFAIIGDRTGGADQAVYEQVWRDIDQARPAFVINVGDVIQGGNDATAAAEWKAVRRVWERYKYQLFFTPGNHDIWSDASRRVYEAETGRPPMYGFDYQNAHFTVLDNSAGPMLSADQTRFLESDLEANRRRSPKFVFFHQPFWIPLVSLGSGEFPLHRLARRYGVAAVVSGHGHQLVTLERDGIRYLEVGSSGAHLFPGAYYHHVLVTVKGTAVQFAVVKSGTATTIPLYEPARADEPKVPAAAAPR